MLELHIDIEEVHIKSGDCDRPVDAMFIADGDEASQLFDRVGGLYDESLKWFDRKGVRKTYTVFAHFSDDEGDESDEEDLGIFTQIRQARRYMDKVIKQLEDMLEEIRSN